MSNNTQRHGELCLVTADFPSYEGIKIRLLQWRSEAGGHCATEPQFVNNLCRYISAFCSRAMRLFSVGVKKVIPTLDISGYAVLRIDRPKVAN